ncbi:c-type cytochrome [Vibrio tapetis]|uniref:Cytochrome c-552 (Modular protein) n=1 Tax=Vibrio tapetis subsp. tapetis TaxID=1671868 RepID=A0A2N8ZLI9_9VIBR|nr:cytochrome C554 [Vibrio tapetis]SON52770.1 Cytochrome c-552 (modular protein) [Vibrio tapetis subsp. tapetis]
MNKLLAIYVLTFSPLFSVVANADDSAIERGKFKSPSCQFCHIPADSTAQSNGSSGSSDPSYPNLNGQNETYLLNAMGAYQSGHRTGGLAEMMQAQLQKLNSDDLKDIAAYYSSQPN